MSRTFQDENFLVWEAYPSAAKFGFSQDPFLVFQCITDRGLRPRSLQVTGDAADAERLVVRASPAELLALLRQSKTVG
jgi:hypothetical protein